MSTWARTTSRPSSTDGSPRRAIELHGTVTQHDGAPLHNLVLEIGRPTHRASLPTRPTRAGKQADPNFFGWGRAATDAAGRYRFLAIRPGRYRVADGTLRAAHINLLVLFSGVMRQLQTVVYFEDGPGNETHPVLASERRAARVARAADRAPRGGRGRALPLPTSVSAAKARRCSSPGIHCHARPVAGGVGAPGTARCARSGSTRQRRLWRAGGVPARRLRARGVLRAAPIAGLRRRLVRRFVSYDRRGHGAPQHRRAGLGRRRNAARGRQDDLQAPGRATICASSEGHFDLVGERAAGGDIVARRRTRSASGSGCAIWSSPTACAACRTPTMWRSASASGRPSSSRPPTWLKELGPEYRATDAEGAALWRVPRDAQPSARARRAAADAPPHHVRGARRARRADAGADRRRRR